MYSCTTQHLAECLSRRNNEALLHCLFIPSAVAVASASVCLLRMFTSAPTGVRAFGPGRPIREDAAHGTVHHTALRQPPVAEESKLWKTGAESRGGTANYCRREAVCTFLCF